MPVAAREIQTSARAAAMMRAELPVQDARIRHRSGGRPCLTRRECGLLLLDGLTWPGGGCRTGPRGDAPVTRREPPRPDPHPRRRVKVRDTEISYVAQPGSLLIA
jgi:hypothetical protein